MNGVQRRASHSAGDSWRKWEDPIVYREPFSWAFALSVWAICASIGIIAGIVVGVYA